MLETPETPMPDLLREIAAGEGSRFSPIAAAVCMDPDIADKLDAILKSDESAEEPSSPQA
jgi:hypothetical protein